MRKNEVIARTEGQRVPSFSEKFVPENTRKRLIHLVAPHVDSYNYFLELGLETAIADILPLEMLLEGSHLVKFKVNRIILGLPEKSDDGSDGVLTPRECRERGLSYTANMTMEITATFNDHDIPVTCRIGQMPIMVMSKKCHLRSLGPKQLVQYREEANETGGYFIMNGIERVIRLLQVPRRNFASAIERSSYKNRGPAYSDKGVAMRCVRADQSSVTVTLHYLNSGGATLKFVVRKQEFLIPVVIVAKALLGFIFFIYFTFSFHLSVYIYVCRGCIHTDICMNAFINCI